MTEQHDPLTVAELERALGRLSPRQREIVLAIRFDGLSYAEIAGRTGLTVKQVENCVADAIYHLCRHIRRGRDTHSWWRRGRA